ncbi:MAG: fumarylacetoacetate hydrolase family protein [Pseudomonadota bacterium]
MPYLFDLPPVPALPVEGDASLFPVRRIFCVGRNYAAHAAEMGAEVDREAPWYFTKSAHAVCPSGAEIAIPRGTQECHYEIELVVALCAAVAPDNPMAAVFGYGCGIDLTRRDLQAAAKAARRPWDTGKDFDNAAILGPLTPGPAWRETGDPSIWLDHNGARVQQGRLSDMVWSVPELLVHLAGLYDLCAGDLIMTGTPAGVGPVAPGSHLTGGVTGLSPVHVTFRMR